MIKVYFEEIFPYEKFPVEFLCYQQLLEKKYNINYLAIPWTQILNSKWLNFPNKKTYDYYISQLLDTHVDQESNITVCQHDDYMKLQHIFKKLKINVVYSPLHDINNIIDGIEIRPIPFTNNFNFIENKNKDIMFSFVGAYTTHDLRKSMHSRICGPNIIYRDSYHVDSSLFNGHNKQANENEYKNILQRSRFSLCPRGSSPSSVRFWESLAAGAIPILVSDNWVLPKWDWENTIIHIPEKTFNKLNYNDIKMLLFEIDNEREEQLRNNCILAYNQFKKENFFSYILGTNAKNNNR
jgi:hypothetical protein